MRTLVCLALLGALALSSCRDDGCVNLTLRYSGRAEGPVIVTLVSTRTGQLYELWTISPTVADAIQTYAPGPNALVGGHCPISHEPFANGNLRFRAWIDVDGDDVAVCRMIPTPPECAPDPQDPVGEGPTPGEPVPREILVDILDPD